jgi:ribonuclease HII
VELLDSGNLWNFDKPYFKKFKSVCGIDEAGRGPLAGPLVACAVHWFSPPHEVLPVADSKVLQEKERKRLFFRIISSSSHFGFGLVSVAEMQHLTMHQANLLAMKRALLNLSLTPGVVLIDGKWTLPGYKRAPQISIIKGDSLSGVIASASILAKVYRDVLMLALDRLFPEYGFCRHKGYATSEHYQVLRRIGLTTEHRTNYQCLKIFLEDGEL